jgi:hypothetical protein
MPTSIFRKDDLNGMMSPENVTAGTTVLGGSMEIGDLFPHRLRFGRDEDGFQTVLEPCDSGPYITTAHAFAVAKQLTERIAALEAAVIEFRTNHDHCVQCDDGHEPDPDDCLVCFADQVLNAQVTSRWE